MKKILAMLLIVVVSLSCVTTAIAANEIKVVLNGYQLYFDVPPATIGGRTMVPLRTIFEALGATVEWDSATKTVTSTKGETTISLTVNQKTMTVNETEVTLDTPASVVDGRTLVPVRAISEAFGTEVNWDGQTRTVSIKAENVEGGKVTMYALDGRTTQVELSKVEAYKKVDWYEEPMQKLYTADGTSKYFKKSQVAAQLKVGWYKEPVVKMYAADGRTKYVEKSKVEANKKVGWYEEPLAKMYAADGRTTNIPKSKIEAYEKVGWYYGKPVTIYNSNGQKKTVGTNRVEDYKKSGWSTTPIRVADGSVSNPYPAINSNTIDFQEYSFYGNKRVILNVTGYARGDDAEAIGGLENAADDQEWILLKLKFNYISGQEELKISSNITDWIYNKSGGNFVVYDDERYFEYSENKEGDIYSRGICNCSAFAGGSMEGYLAVLTDKGAGMPIIKLPTLNGNKFVTTSGAAKLVKKTKADKIAENPILSKCKLELPATPKTLENYKTEYSDKDRKYIDILQSKVKVSEITYEFKESSGGKVNLYVYFKGEKIYDVNGAGQTSSCKIGWKLYDSEGYVLKDGTLSTIGIAMNEKFKDAEEEIYSLEPGAYRLEIMGVNGY